MTLTATLAGETLDWMGDEHDGPDPFGELLAFALATYVDGAAVTPRGFDVSDELEAGL